MKATTMLENVAIVGATGVVGREFIKLIKQRGFPAKKLTLLASKRSAGTVFEIGDTVVHVQETSQALLSDVSMAVFSAGADTSQEFAPIVARNGGVVVDNSSAFRMDPDVPLVIPEINSEDIAKHQGIIANPNCTTIMMLMAVGPIHRRFPVKRIVVSTYQAASGAGIKAMEELRMQTLDYLEGRDLHPKAFRHPIAFNLFTHDSAIGENGYNGEENKVINETRKILHEPALPVAVTCVRVPVLRAHSESVNLEFHEPVSVEVVRDVLSSAPGVRIVDNRSDNHFPMPFEASDRDEVFVGRIRQDASRPDGTGIELFVCGDQIRKGAALNAIQIAEYLAGVSTAV
jgi:aspartate-semialdehyde dehydrogenase